MVRTFVLIGAMLIATAPAAAADPQLAKAIAAYDAFVLARDPTAQVLAGKTARRVQSLAPADLAEGAAFARQALAQLKGIDDDRLSEDERVSLGVLRSQLEELQAWPLLADDRFAAPYLLGHRLSEAQSILSANPLANDDDAGAYTSVISSLADELDIGRRRLIEQAQRGIRLPKLQVARSRTTLDRFGPSAAQWAAPPAERLGKLSAAARARLAQEAGAAARRVAVAADAFKAAFGPDYLAAAPERVGLSQYPGGDAIYRRQIRLHLTRDVEPHELAELGQRMLDETNRDLAQIAATLNVPGGRAGLRAFVDSDPAFRAASAAEVAAKYQRCSDRIAPLLSKGFERLPKAPYRAVPADVPGMTFGYYSPPLPGSPVGEYRFPAQGADKRSHVNACGLIYHELMPGHHLETAITFENETIPQFRRNTFLTVYSEGWAEYASNYARDLGVYADPRELLGRLTMNAMTFSRLVVDVGLNHDGWSLERARAFMRDNTFLTDAEIDSELLRYGADMPGQALTYGYGHLAIRQIRDEVAKATGDRFDIRRFHSLVLEGGPLPLDVLRAHVRRGFGLPVNPRN